MGPPPWAPPPLRDDLLHVGSRRWASGFGIGIYWGYHGDNFYKTYKPTNLIHDAKKGVSENESHWLWGRHGWLWGKISMGTSMGFNLFQLVSTTKFQFGGPYFRHGWVGSRHDGLGLSPAWGPRHDLCNQLLASGFFWIYWKTLKNHIFLMGSLVQSTFSIWKNRLETGTLFFFPM